MLRSVTTRSPNDFEYQETQIIVFAIPNGSNLVVFTYGSYESYLEDMAPSKAIELDAVLIDCSNDEQVRKILPGCNGQNHVFEFARSWRVVVLPSSRGAAS